MSDLLAHGRRLIEVWNARDAQAVAAFYGPATFADPLVPKGVQGATLEAYAKGIFAAFPDLIFKVHAEATGPGLVMFEWSQCGTNQGPIMGMPATQRYVEIPAVSVLRYDAQGRLQTHTDYWDLVRLQKDLKG